MITPVSARLHPPSPFQWPLDLHAYDCAPALSSAEQRALDQFEMLYEHMMPSRTPPLSLAQESLSRLLLPIRDALRVTGADARCCNLAGWFLFRQMHHRRVAF